MAGIAGAVGVTSSPAALADRLTSALSHGDERTGAWTGPEAVLCSVQHAVDGRGTPLVGRRGDLRLVLSGNVRIPTAAGGPPGRAERLDADAEEVLALYEARGSQAFAALDGSFALAIHDAASGELVVASDRFSSRPTYWARGADGSVTFASHVHAVLQNPTVSRALDERAVRELFHFQRVLGTRTLSRDIQLVPPGTALRVVPGETRLEPWFSMDYVPEHRSDDAWADEMAEAFRLSTARSVAGHDRVGLLLSGGLDARMVVAAAADDLDLECFHFGDEPNQEYARAKRVAAAGGHEVTYLRRAEDHYFQLFEQAVDVGDSLNSFVHGHVLGFLPQPSVDVMLHGFVPEIYFRGTSLPHTWRQVRGKKVIIADVDRTIDARNVGERVARHAIHSLTAQRLPQYFTPPWAHDFEDQIRDTADSMVAEAKAHSDDPYDWFMWSDTRYHSQTPCFLFEQAIRSEQAERSVIFHNHILDLHLRMPISARSDSRIWIRAVRRLNPQVAAVADANTGLSPFTRLPWPAEAAIRSTRLASERGRAAVGRTRIGRGTSWARGLTSHSWPNIVLQLRQQLAWRTLIDDIIHDPEAIDPSIFDVAHLEVAVDEHMQGVADHRWLLMLLVTFGRWHKLYGPPGRGLRTTNGHDPAADARSASAPTDQDDRERTF